MPRDSLGRTPGLRLSWSLTPNQPRPLFALSSRDPTLSPKGSSDQCRYPRAVRLWVGPETIVGGTFCVGMLRCWTRGVQYCLMDHSHRWDREPVTGLGITRGMPAIWAWPRLDVTDEIQTWNLQMKARKLPPGFMSSRSPASTSCFTLGNLFPTPGWIDSCQLVSGWVLLLFFFFIYILIVATAQMYQEGWLCCGQQSLPSMVQGQEIAVCILSSWFWMVDPTCRGLELVLTEKSKFNRWILHETE